MVTILPIHFNGSGERCDNAFDNLRRGIFVVADAAAIFEVGAAEPQDFSSVCRGEALGRELCEHLVELDHTVA